MSVRATELFQAGEDVMKVVADIKHGLDVARIELVRLRNIGQDTAQEEAQLAALEQTLALYAEHLGPGSAARYARMARQGQI